MPDASCPHVSLSGAEGPISVLGRMPTRWRCDQCDTTIEAGQGQLSGNPEQFEDHDA